MRLFLLRLYALLDESCELFLVDKYQYGWYNGTDFHGKRVEVFTVITMNDEM